jgi:hypothetical protein
MGTYTDLTIANYPLLTSKSEVVPEALTVFRETDRRVFTRRVSERNVLVWGEPNDPTDEKTETAIEYSCETGKVIDRLNVMGFTLQRVQTEFETGLRFELEKFQSWADDGESEWFQDEWDFLKTLTFDQYAKSFSEVISQRLRPVPFDDCNQEDLNPIIKYILGENDDYLFGFLASDVRLLMRLACDVVPEHSKVVQDLTQLVAAGYYGEEEPVAENAINALRAGHPENSPRIILTEGSTDRSILREALAILYPHLSPYYSFLDFDTSRSQGGAGHLVSLVKAFAAAGITNRVIALFDNDTSAREATSALKRISLPPNIIFLHYPELEILRSYPTLGPSGPTQLDINGLAASIELYLGEDILRGDGNSLTPIQWKGFSETLRQYQGEVLRKTALQNAFHERAARCRKDPNTLNATNWSGLSAILEEVFHAFD